MTTGHTTATWDLPSPGTGSLTLVYQSDDFSSGTADAGEYFQLAFDGVMAFFAVRAAQRGRRLARHRVAKFEEEVSGHSQAAGLQNRVGLRCLLTLLTLPR